MSKPNSAFVLNPSTNRYVAVDSKVHRRLIKAGIVAPIVNDATPSVPDEIPVTETKTENIPTEAPPIKELLANELTDIVAEHKKEFAKELTQKQTDALLRKLLYEKLCVSKKTKKPTKHKKPKKPKKVTYKIKTPPSSSCSDTESIQSDSSSDE